jgi:hypothetical protein
VQTLYSFCHALALYDVVRGRTDGWVATGAKQASRTSVRVTRLVGRWCIGVQAALWSAIAWNAGHFGLGRWWLMIAFTLLNLVVVAPLVRADASVSSVRTLPARIRQTAEHIRQYNPQLGGLRVGAATATVVAKAALDKVPEPQLDRRQPATLGWLQSISSREPADLEKSAA